MLRPQTVCHVPFILALLFSSVARAENDAASPPLAALTGKPGGLTADEVAGRATATSLDVEAKRHDVEAAQAQVDRALAAYFPRLALGASYERLSPVTNVLLGNVIPSPNNATTFTASLAVPLTDYVFRIVQAHEGATAQNAASKKALRAAGRKAEYDARALYYDWVRAELDAAVAEQNLELGKENLVRVKSLAAAGSASPADVARVEATVAASDFIVAQSRNLAALQRERVAIAMHDTSGRNYQIGDDFQPPSAAPESYELEPLVRVAERQRPELEALAWRTKALEKQAAVARAQAIPRIDAFAQWTMANPNQRYFPQEQTFHGTWALGVELTYSPNDTATGLSEAAGASANAAENDAQRRALVDAIHQEVTDAVLAYRTAITGIETSSRRLTAAETSYRTRRERFLAEKATTVELTEAQTELFNARLEAVEAQVAVHRARARIAYATASRG